MPGFSGRVALYPECAAEVSVLWFLEKWSISGAEGKTGGSPVILWGGGAEASGKWHPAHPETEPAWLADLARGELVPCTGRPLDWDCRWVRCWGWLLKRP